jgi:HPr kinase/phosphorylase
MPIKPRIKQPEFITVEQFFREAGEVLNMELVGTDVGMKRQINEPSVNRPGLVLAGFQDYFAYKRVQVMGNSELSYIEQLAEEERRDRFAQLCQFEIPCIIVARGRGIAEDLVRIANDAGICVFQTKMMTMRFLNLATLRLDFLFSPSMSVHGCMVDVQGIGLLVQGPSGVGKSETLVGLLERGASLVADDKVNLRLNEEREVIGTANALGRGMIEMRGVGVVDVSRVFGIGAVRLAKRLDLIVHLVPAGTGEVVDMERFGLETKTETVLGLNIATMSLPVTVGRDTASMIHLAALHQKLRSFGVDTARDFNERLLKKMADNQLG